MNITAGFNVSAFFTTRDIATLLGVEVWQIQRLFESGALVEPQRFAGKRVITGRQIPAIIDALRARGWLPVGGLEPRRPGTVSTHVDGVTRA